jgi:hypothetical protein
MKKLKWLIFTSVLAVACNKSSSDPSPILGKWQLVEQIGGLAGSEHFPPGNYIQFNADMTVIQIVPTYPDPDTLRGTYQLISTWPATGKNLLLIYSGTSLLRTDSVLVSGDQLILSVPPKCCDIPYMWIYKR